MSRRLAIPRSVTVRGRRWRVAFTGRHKRAEMRGLRGLCVVEDRVIWIDSRCSADERGRTLCHEWIHAALAGTPGLTNEVEERIAYRLEGPLHSLLLSGALSAVPEEA